MLDDPLESRTARSGRRVPALTPASRQVPTVHAMSSALEESREYSLRLLETLRLGIAAEGPGARPFAIIAAAGSLGRLEAGPSSDLDTILVLSDEMPADAVGESLTSKLWQLVHEAGLKAPKPGGVFREPVARSTLLAETAVGRIDESPSVFGKRIQMLLDARAIVGRRKFDALRNDILQWYLAPARAFQMPSPWSYLLSDLLRYGNSYGNWQSVKVGGTDDDSWALRQVKLRSTRLVTWMGLWLMIHRAQTMPDHGVDWLAENLALTPLERVRLVVEPISATRYARIHACYQKLHSSLQDAEIRRRLVECKEPIAEHAAPAVGVAYIELMAQCAELRRELAEFHVESLADAPTARQVIALPF